MRFSTDGSSYGGWQTYRGSASITLPAGNGGKHVYVQYENAAGTVSPAESDAIVLDTTTPTITTAPTVGIAAQPLSSGSAQLKVSWAGSDSGSGIQGYSLQEKVDGGSYRTVSLPTPAATSVTVPAAPGHSYQFQVKATDRAGNASGYRAGRLDKLSLVQETASAIAYSSGWAQATVAGASGGKVKDTTRHGSRATFSFSGIAVALVTDLAPGHGTATLAVDGGSTTTVDTAAGTLRASQVPYSRSFGSGNHKLVVTDSGNGSAPPGSTWTRSWSCREPAHAAVAVAVAVAAGVRTAAAAAGRPRGRAGRC